MKALSHIDAAIQFHIQIQAEKIALGVAQEKAKAIQSAQRLMLPLAEAQTKFMLSVKHFSSDDSLMKQMALMNRSFQNLMRLTAPTNKAIIT